MYVVVKGHVFDSRNYPWFVAYTKKEAIDTLHKLGFRMSGGVLTSANGKGEWYAKPVKVTTAKGILNIAPNELL